MQLFGNRTRMVRGLHSGAINEPVRHRGATDKQGKDTGNHYYFYSTQYVLIPAIRKYKEHQKE
jgi:hypothetical protein